METIPSYFITFADEVKKQFAAMNARFDQVDNKFDQVDARFDQVDARLDDIDNRFDGVDDKLDLIATTVLEHSEILRRLDPQVGNHEERIARLEQSVTQLRYSKS